MVSDEGFWDVQLLGRFRLRSGETTWEQFQTRKTEALFVLLTLRPDRRWSREELCDLLWPDSDRDSARNRLSQAVSWLRPRLELSEAWRGRLLLSDRMTLQIAPSLIRCDAIAFEAAVTVARTTSEPERREQAWAQAIDLYRGDLAPALGEEWIVGERQRLRTHFLLAVRERLIPLEERRAWAEALIIARHALTFDPLSEELQGNVLRLLVRSGQRVEAQRQLTEFERTLTKSLGQTPSEALIRLLELPSDREVAPVASSTPEEVSSLPVPITRFFGRAAEQETIRGKITQERARLITITGLGGSGKTRLAIEVGHDLRAHFGGAVGFVPLADIRDPALIFGAIAAALKGDEKRGSGTLREITEVLRRRPFLLLVDNLEHFSEAAAPLIRSLLEGAPELTVLATSRHLLGITGEQEIALSPLPVPEPSGAPPGIATDPVASVQLFLDRARAVRPDLSLTPENTPVIEALCARLEGWPLAIELCAAWAQTLTPEQMLEHLNRRFDLLVSRRRDIPARHRTLRATMEYSYLLLPDPLRHLLRSLSVFRGGWTMEAAVTICGAEDQTTLDMLSAITELRERSLVVALAPSVSGESGGSVPEMRYCMLESVRDFAAEQQTIAERSIYLERHFEYFEAMVCSAESLSDSGPSGTQIRRWAEELENLRAALSWAEENDRSLRGLEVAVALTPFWEMHGHAAEGQQRIERLLARTSGQLASASRAKAHLACGELARARTELDAAYWFLEQALSLYRALDDSEGIAHTLMILGTLANSKEENERARMLLEEALGFARQCEDSSMTARILANLGTVAMDEEDWPQAWEIFREILAFRRSEGNIKRIASTLNNLGLVARYRGDYTAALSLLEEGCQRAQEIADRPGIGISLLNLATVYRLDGRPTEARSRLTEALRITYQVEDRRAFAWAIKEAGHLACAVGDFETGVRLLAAAEHFRHQLGISFKPADPTERERDTEHAMRTLTADHFRTAWEEGSDFSFATAYDLALKKVCRAEDLGAI